MSGHTDEEHIDAITREITNEIRCEERARVRIAEAPLEGDVYLLKILLDVIDNQSAALKEQHPIVDSHVELVKALEEILTLAVCVGVVDPAQHRNMLENIERISRAALATLTARKVG